MTGRTPVQDLAAAIDANVPVLLMGAPGTAKTAMIEALAAERGAYLEIVIASAQDPSTILGIPMPSDDRKYTEATIPGWARRINEHDAAGEPTILFLDELTTVPEIIAAPLLGVVQSRRADGWTLPAATRIVAAANPPDLAVSGWALAPAMANRWAHIEWPVPVQDWTTWAAAQPSPALQSIAAYIRDVPTALLMIPQDLSQRSGPWASPRAWTNAARMIDQTGDPSSAALTVGNAAASQYVQWAALRDVPSVPSMLSGTALPTRPDAFRTALDSLVSAVTPDTRERTIEILTAAVPTDPAVVALVARTFVQTTGAAGIAGLVAVLRQHGAALGSAAAS